ncbi:hypothetical protein EGW08_003063, partial [Elysia chlorotica]
DEEIAMKTGPPREWELDVRSLISSKRWLQNYGLKKNRLQLNQILPAIGFKLSDDFDETLKRPVSSRYGGGLFRQMLHPDGRTFNISCSKDKLLQLEKRLLQAMYLFRRRLEWLTTESRRTFGVIEERAVTIVLDIRNMSPQQFDQYKTALERVLREQVSQLAKFNLIRATEQLEMYSPECAPVSHDTIQNAIQWLWSLDRLAPVSATAAAEGILRALADQHNEAVYLFTEGTSVDSGKEILMDKVARSKFKVPVHVVSFNCDCSNTVKFLKQFAKASRGKFHAYAVVMELDAYEAQPTSDSLTSRANIMLKRKTFGGVPAGAGVREDVILIFEEVEEARNNLAQVRMLIERAPEPKRAPSEDIEPGRPISLKDEQYMSSREWLQIYGLDARKLGLYDVLGGVAFKHLDGVIDIMEPPTNGSQTDAVVNQKLINARYCDRFPIVKWRDGRVVHVQVTPDVHRTYEERVQVALNKVQQRIDWLNQGSRALFGTLVEDMIYILIDTSASMQPSLGFVKQKLFVLMQEQLRHKKKFNLVTFNSKASGWKDRLVEVSERSLQSAWTWVQNLSCWGTTNTYGALQLAMADPQVQAIYLLTDGRPDQPPKSIIAQVQMQKHIPVHTISFNCNDSDANHFLNDSDANHFLYGLAEATGGRYHYFSEAGPPVDQPDSWESMDIRILKDEIKKGLENLDKLAGLRDECTRMAWKRETEDLRKSIDSARESAMNTGRLSAMPPLDSKDIYRPDSEMRPMSPTPPTSSPPPRPISSTPPPPRPSSAPPSRSVSVMSPRLIPTPPPSDKPDRPDSSHTGRLRGSGGLPVKLPKRPKSAKVALRKPLVAGKTNFMNFSPLLEHRKEICHTRTSMLRTLNSSGRFSPNEWLLPETKSLFQVQAERQKEIAQRKSLSVPYKTWAISTYGLKTFEKNTEHKFKIILNTLSSNSRASEMSSKQWLSKHGLVAKRLTILDALGSTFIPHKAKYVSILDKHVMSKVFDEVLPIAHVSKSQNVRLVNPNGVNLKEYEKKVKAAQEKFRKRLNALVWNVLSESAKEEFDSDGPVSFEENQSKILLHLEDANWPVREQDVTLLANEIARAEKFLHQSRALRKAAAGEDDWEGSEESSFELPPNDDKSSPSKALRASSPATSERSNDSDKSREDREKGDKGKNSPRRSKSDDESPVRSEKGSQDYEGLGQVIRSVDRSVEGKIKEGAEVIKSKVRVRLDRLRGQRVIARKDQDGLYYPAVVLKCSDPRHALVRYDGNEEAQVLTRNVIPVGGAVARPYLYVGDYVLIRVVYLDTKDECYVPAIIQVEPQRASASQKFYSVLMYNGQKATTMRKYLVKISKERFELASMYIAEQQNEDREEAQDLLYVSPRASNKRNKTRPDDNRSRSRSRSRSQSRMDNFFDDDVSPEKNEEFAEENEKDDEHNETSRSSKERQLEELQQKLLSQQKKQESQKKKLKKKAKRLAQKRKAFKKSLLKDMSDGEPGKNGDAVALVDGEADPCLIKLRKQLEHLRPGEEALARWSDDGWYFRGIIRQYHGDYSYDVEDSTGFIERIWREDLISENDASDKVFQLDHKAIALHPDYSFSYAPGVVTAVNDSELEILFYDGRSASLPWGEVYHYHPAKTSKEEKASVVIPEGNDAPPEEQKTKIGGGSAKYRQDVAYIRAREEKLLGAAVVARDDRTGAYYPGTVKKRSLDKNCSYIVSWADGSDSAQDAIHIFSAYTRRPNLSIGDRVLACVDPVHVKFLPGHLAGKASNGRLVVKFCNSEMRDDVDPSLCYWLGQQYYDAAVKYFKTHDPSYC